MDALKEQLYQKASDLGAAMVKTAPVERWESIPIQDPAFWPQNIWPWCKSVIVLAIPMFLPMAGSTPSMVYQELYNTSNRVMDDMAYQLANCILRLGWRASFFRATATPASRSCSKIRRRLFPMWWPGITRASEPSATAIT